MHARHINQDHHHPRPSPSPSPGPVSRATMSRQALDAYVDCSRLSNIPGYTYYPGLHFTVFVTIGSALDDSKYIVDGESRAHAAFRALADICKEESGHCVGFDTYRFLITRTAVDKDRWGLVSQHMHVTCAAVPCWCLFVGSGAYDCRRLPLC